MKNFSKLLKHLFVPHRGNAFRPHAFRHQALVFYGVLLVISQLIFGVAFASNSLSPDQAKAVQQEVISGTNVERTKAGVSTLKENQGLDYAAKQKLDDMFANNYWDHTGPNGQTAWQFISEVGYKYDLAGENLAKGYTTTADVVAAWMASPTHKANMLDGRFRDIGVAVGSGKIGGEETTLIVQLFGVPLVQAAGAITGNVITPPAATLAPSFSIQNAIQSQKAPYIAIWSIIFLLVVVDGVMIRRLGLSTSPHHMFHFRTSLFVILAGLGILMVSVVSIA